MSWFSVDALKGLSEQVLNVKEQVQSAITFDKEMLEKLTLTSPELKAERERIDAEERRKEQVKDMLSGMMPWETRDPERDILVEECKESILKLSSDKDVFYGPYPMPKLSVNVDDDKDDSDEAQGEVENAHEAEKDGVEHGKHRMPSEDSLEKLKTLEPLPPLLQEFDLDTHVGLIKRLLKEDPKLVKMQSSLGGGEHEKTFWRNYFFHCAWCRYEAGLSIDEIWSDQPEKPSEDIPHEISGPTAFEEETITFEKHEEEVAPEKAFPSDPTTDPNAPFRTKESVVEKTVGSAAAGSPDSTDFEMVNESASDGAPDVELDEAVDYELDELEAEIARELED